MAPLVGRDAVFLEQCAADFVQTAQQQLPAVGIGGEGRVQATVIRNHLSQQIDDQLVGAALRVGNQLLDVGLRQSHRQHAVAVAVGDENVGERRRDDYPEAILRE